MKPTPVADEMFPEGAGPYMDLEEVNFAPRSKQNANHTLLCLFSFQHENFIIKLFFKAGGSNSLIMDLAANEKAVHADFFNGSKTFILKYNIDNLTNLPIVHFPSQIQISMICTTTTTWSRKKHCKFSASG